MVALVGAVLAGALAGAAWAMLPGWWEAWFRVPLVVTTLLLNYVAALFATYLAVYPLRDKSGGSTVAQTHELPSALQLPIVIDATPLHAGIVAAVVLPLAVLWLLSRTSLGYSMRMTGLNRDFAEAGGVPMRRTILITMGLSGALCGLAGTLLVLGETHRYVNDSVVGPGTAWTGLTAGDARRLQPGADRGQRLLPRRAADRRDGAAAADRGAAAARQRDPGRDHPDGRGAAVARAPGAARAAARMSEVFDIGLVGSAIRLTSPILLAALGGLFTDRGGMFNISLEGQMLVGAFFGVAGLYWTQSAWAGLALGVAAATALSLLFGLWVVRLDGDAIIVGLAINLLAVGLTAYLTLPVFGVQGSFDDPALEGLPQLWGFSPLVYLAALLVPATWWLLFHHPFGVRLRAVGEDPEAAEGAGIDPVRMKFAACTLCGVLCGLAGAQLALSLVTQWVQGMTAGRGFIALVAIMLARSNPIGVALTSLLFGFAYALAVRLQGVGIPPQFVSMLPTSSPSSPSCSCAVQARARAGGARHEAASCSTWTSASTTRSRSRCWRRAPTPRSSRSAACTATARWRTRRATRWWCSRRAGSATCRWRPAPRRRSWCRCTSPASSTAPTGSATSASPRPPGRPTGEHAADQLVRLGRERPGELDLLAVGPLTNLGLALRQDPDALARYRSVVIMGGSGPYPQPGVLREFDANIDHDPDAARLVFAAPRAELVMVGVNVTTPGDPRRGGDRGDRRRRHPAGAPGHGDPAVLPRLLPPQVGPAHLLHARPARGRDPRSTRATSPRWLEGPVNVIHDGALARAWLMAREDGGALVQAIEPAPPTRVAGAVDSARFRDDLVAALVSPLPR